VRPRLVQEYLMSPPEDRATVGEQIRALHDLYLAEEGLVMIPSHDDEHLATLIADGLVKEQFAIEAP
jgi:hypothetical protein